MDDIVVRDVRLEFNEELLVVRVVHGAFVLRTRESFDCGIGIPQ